MQAVYIHDVFINLDNASEAYRKAARPVQSADGKTTEWMLPKGTVIEGDDALLRVSCGLAEPSDEECAAACGMDAEQLKRCQRRCLSAMRGIRGKLDQELFMTYVIDGYAPDSTDENTKYIPGERWEEFHGLKAEAKKEKGKI